MKQRLNVGYKEPASQRSRDEDVQLWCDIWDALRRDSPNDVVFQAFSRDDLINEVLGDPEDDDDDDGTDDFEGTRGYN